MAPLTQLTADELATAEGLLANARATLMSASADLDAAQADQARAAAALAALVAQERGVRAQLPAVPMPGDADVLAAALEVAIVRSRAGDAAVMRATERLALAEVECELAAAELAWAEVQRECAAAAKSTADARAGRLVDAASALSGAALQAVPADAAEALANGTLAAARARVADDLPGALAARARQRRTAAHVAVVDARAEAQDAGDRLGDDLASHGGDAGKVARRRLQLDRAEAAYADALRGRERLEGALATLAHVVAAAPLTAGERARIALHGAAEDGRDTADEGKVAGAEAGTAVAAAKPAARATKRSRGSKPAPAAAAMSAEAAAETAAMATDATATTATMSAEASAATVWEAAVPDALWQQLDDLDSATAVLDELAASDPGALATTLGAAEDAYGSALRSAADAARKSHALAVAQGGATARAGIAERLDPARSFSAMRGDA